MQLTSQGESLLHFLLISADDVDVFFLFTQTEKSIHEKVSNIINDLFCLTGEDFVIISKFECLVLKTISKWLLLGYFTILLSTFFVRICSFFYPILST